MARRGRRKAKTVESLRHDEASRPNIPSAEYQDALDESISNSIRVPYECRNPDLDPQLVWRGKEVVNPGDLVVPAPPLFIQEKVHPKILIDDLIRRTATSKQAADEPSGSEEYQFDLLAAFNGVTEGATEFYRHEANWTNRMILGDSLNVMASLAEREGLRGRVQCIYIDPPYGIRFNSNFQWSTTSRDVKDGSREHLTRDPEMVKAFRDTWREGVHSYMTYLRDRLLVAHDLLTTTGSVFVQIGDENVHRVRCLMDEVFGESNFVSQINFKSMGALGQADIPNVYDYLVWYAREKPAMKFRPLHRDQDFSDDPEYRYVADAREPLGYRVLQQDEIRPPDNDGLFRRSTLTSSGFTPSCTFDFDYQSSTYKPFGRKSWRTNAEGMNRLSRAGRLFSLGSNLYFRRYADDSQLVRYENSWTDAPAASTRIYVVQTAEKFVTRCLLMTTDPGDLVLDPTCGSGTTASVAEQWGRRWITIDTSRVALALARARLMGRRYPWYYLTDSRAGQEKLAELTGRPAFGGGPTSGSVRCGFVYKRMPHVMLKDVANNAEIDVIWQRYGKRLDAVLSQLTRSSQFSRGRAQREDRVGESELPSTMQEWDVQRDFPDEWPEDARGLFDEFWNLRVARQEEIDAAIIKSAEFVHLYDRPYEDKSKVRVAGPFTVESLSPHREVALNEKDQPILGGGQIPSTPTSLK